MPNPNLIPKLLRILTQTSGTATVNNFYTLAPLLSNVDQYLRALISHPFSGDLLVGEAPGWAGCALTGIPFLASLISSNETWPKEPAPCFDGMMNKGGGKKFLFEAAVGAAQ